MITAIRFSESQNYLFPLKMEQNLKKYPEDKWASSQHRICLNRKSPD